MKPINGYRPEKSAHDIHMDDLFARIAVAVQGEPAGDIAFACAAMMVFAITQTDEEGRKQLHASVTSFIEQSLAK